MIKKTKLMSSIETENWFENFILNKFNNAQNENHVEIFKIIEIKNEIQKEGYSRRLIDEHVIINVLNKNNMIYKKIGEYYCTTKNRNDINASNNLIHKAANEVIDKDIKFAMIVKWASIGLIILGVIAILFEFKSNQPSVNYIGNRLCYWVLPGIIYTRITLCNIESYKKLKVLTE